jgi:hypothetical protein
VLPRLRGTIEATDIAWEQTAMRDTRSLVKIAVSSVLSTAAILLGRYLCSAVIQSQGWITLIQRPERWVRLALVAKLYEADYDC